MAIAYPGPSAASTISEGTLDAAVESGLLSMEQARGLRELESNRIATVYPRDDEQFRFISGFSDIFVTIGIGLFLGALAYFGLDLSGPGSAGCAIGIASWLLAEYFTRKRRMALPSIVLLLSFTAAVFVAAGVWTEHLSGLQRTAFYDFRDHPLVLTSAALAAVAATALHYWRFRVPITIAAGVGALVFAILGLMRALSQEFVEAAITPILLISGLLVFALAMRFDLSDPQRETRRTDIAFWLHMLAAPLIVHPLVKGLLLGNGDIPTTTSAWGILMIFAGLSIVAILVDRRAILVSGLTYAGIAFGTLLGGAGLIDSAIPFTMLALGALVLLLSAGWHTLRRSLLGFMPDGLARRFPVHT